MFYTGIVTGFNPHNMQYSVSIQHVECSSIPQRELGPKWTEPNQLHISLGDKEEFVLNNNCNGNDPWKMWSLTSLLNPKINCTGTSKVCSGVIMERNSRILVI